MRFSKKRLNKRGTQATLAGLIIVLIVGIILVVAVKRMSDIDNDREICRLSVLKKAETMIAKLPTQSSIECDTNYIQIKKEGIYLNNKKKLRFEDKIKEKSGDQIKSFLADQMFDCWYQFLEGKVDFAGVESIVDSPSRCFICSSINFEEDYLEGFTFEEWELYLKDKELKKGGSYFNYLTSNNDKKTSIYPDSYLTEEFDSIKGKNMIISFIILEQAALAHWPVVAPYFIEEVAGYKEGFRADIHLINAEDFTSKCDQLY
jgi:hypothetical protein